LKEIDSDETIPCKENYFYFVAKGRFEIVTTKIVEVEDKPAKGMSKDAPKQTSGQIKKVRKKFLESDHFLYLKFQGKLTYDIREKRVYEASNLDTHFIKPFY
jgi:hypothetical protein